MLNIHKIDLYFSLDLIEFLHIQIFPIDDHQIGQMRMHSLSMRSDRGIDILIDDIHNQRCDEMPEKNSGKNHDDENDQPRFHTGSPSFFLGPFLSNRNFRFTMGESGICLVKKGILR